MQIVNNGATSEIKKIFASATITGTLPLPVSNMGQRMLNRDALTQCGTSSWCQLTFS
jgi:hypothetical protein